MARKLKVIFLLLLIALAVTGSIWIAWTSELAGRIQNLHLFQAEAFLEGRLDIPEKHHDVSIYDGRFYVSFPPSPAFLLMPLVALVKLTSRHIIFVSLFLSILNIVVFRRMLRKLGIQSEHIPWITAAFFLGTGYWLSVCWSYGVWFYAHVVAVTFMLLAINESLGKGRGILVGLFLGMAFLSRHLSLYATPFLLFVLWENPRFNSRKSKILNIAGFCVFSGICGALYLALNKARFGNMLDTGYSYFPLHGLLKARVDKFGTLHFAYLPFNLINMFLQGFHIDFKGPILLNVAGTHPFGTSITFASPFVFFAFWARWKRKLFLAAWVSIVITLVHVLFYYNNGWVQLNAQRFTLDFFPILMVLVALGVKRVPERIWKSVVVYSVILNALALYIVPLLERNMKF